MDHDLQAATAVVLDRDALVVLADELRDGDCAVTFARTYHSMLPRRVERVATALRRTDLAAAMDAILSLKVSSTTVGTAELAALAHDLEDHVRRRDVAAARARAHGLPAAADRAGGALADYLADYLTAHRAS